KKDIKNRQGAVELLLLQIDLHILGDKIACGERRVHRIFQVVQRSGQVRDAEWIGWRAHRFLAAENVNRCVREKLVHVKKIRSAKHVEGDRYRCVGFGKICGLPKPKFLELAHVELGKRVFKKSRVFLPGGIVREWGER